ncbi:MAG: Jag N-terminal domain-containing protein [Candidatus Omnitrophica bacterium]|nr:Jag N-terminal domain-containing protein [Candidatus Omnitrophota bacterium]MDD5351606.1 Jag N-terminal domain-containing protein [Candidatus Omnitrophota bacterium]MDD5550815.1 Jag N-terminal domain-containing protein [Candidatus Omnitrophota bacterium]
MEPLEIEAKTVSEAIKKALGTLKVSRKEIEVQVLSEPKMGLFGMGGSRPAKIRVSLKRKNS